MSEIKNYFAAGNLTVAQHRCITAYTFSSPCSKERDLVPLKFKQDGRIILPLTTKREMQELEGGSIREMLVKRLNQLKEWLEPDAEASTIVTSLKMIYKAFAVLILIAFSPVILIILLFVFLAAL